MNSRRIQELIQIHRDGLLKNVIPFWMAHVWDPECGGYLHYLDRDSTVTNHAKDNRWAGPFHLPRMHFKCWELLEVMLRNAAKPQLLTGNHQQVLR